MIILANDGIAASAQKELEALGHEVDTKHYEGEDLLKRLGEVDVVVVRSATKIRHPEIDAGIAGKLKLVIRAGVGIDNIDADYAKEKGLEVTNTPKASSNAVAELVLAHMMCLCRNLHKAQRSVPAGKWQKKEYKGTEIAGKTLGIIGLGRIGRCLAQKCIALGMTVIYEDIYRNEQAEKDLPCEYVSLDELFARADFISIHTPFLGKPVIGPEEFKKLKKGVYIVDAARGGTIDEAALLQAIEDGIVAGAGLDVFMEEPTKNEALLACDSISFSPHIGASTSEAQDRIGENIVELIKEKC